MFLMDVLHNLTLVFIQTNIFVFKEWVPEVKSLQGNNALLLLLLLLFQQLLCFFYSYIISQCLFLFLHCFVLLAKAHLETTTLEYKNCWDIIEKFSIFHVGVWCSSYVILFIFVLLSYFLKFLGIWGVGGTMCTNDYKVVVSISTNTTVIALWLSSRFLLKI